MDFKPKQKWSVEETTCLLAVWSSAEVQKKLEGASRTKPVFEHIQREMAAGGYERSIEQIVNKLKKLKKEYRDQKTELGHSGNGRPRFNSPHFQVLESVLGDRPACNATGALNSATAVLESMQEDTTLEQTSTEPDLTELDVGEELLQLTPGRSSSPAPSSSSGRSSASGQSRPGKRKRDPADMLEYLERADDKFLEHSRDMNTALLQKLDDHATAYVALMGRMVTLMEAQQKK